VESLNRERMLGVLYDISLTIGGEVHLKSLLQKTLQRLLFHTGYPCGLILIKGIDSSEGVDDEFHLAMAIGDSEAIKRIDSVVHVQPEKLMDKIEVVEAKTWVSQLPSKQDKYKYLLKVPIGEVGVILLLYSQDSSDNLPLEQMFATMASHFAKAILLCEVNDRKNKLLKDEVIQRTSEIAEREEQLRLLLSSTAEGIFGMNSDGVCTFANTSALRMLGYTSADELIGRVIHDMLHHTKANGEKHPISDCKIAHASKAGLSIHVDDEVFWHKDGHSFPVEYRSIPIRKDDEIVGQIISFTDITERLLAEHQKREEQVKLEHTQRLESLGVLTGGIAHDFNNLLTAILGNASLSKMKIDELSPAHQLLDRVIDASESAADLCNQMLAYSGKGKFTVTPISLSSLVEKMAKLLEVSIQKGVTLRYNLDDRIPLIDADLAQMQQVIMNLITNANEALEGNKGVITIATGVMDVDQGYLASAYAENNLKVGQYVFVEVSDTGCGMSTEQQARMFEPFYTTKVMGRGLGMSAMLGIVRGHDGAIKIYSELGKGTAIKVFFPVSDALEANEKVVETERTNLSGVTVLVVDDEPMLRDVAVSLLEFSGVHVITAENGKDGIEKYFDHKNEIDIVLLDMMMPVMNGEETFQKLRAIDPEVKVLLCSGYNEQDATQQFTGKGLAGFIQKPYRSDALITAISDVL